VFGVKNLHFVSEWAIGNQGHCPACHLPVAFGKDPLCTERVPPDEQPSRLIFTDLTHNLLLADVKERTAL
jgi:hypothetical protein